MDNPHNMDIAGGDGYTRPKMVAAGPVAAVGMGKSPPDMNSVPREGNHTPLGGNHLTAGGEPRLGLGTHHGGGRPIHPGAFQPVEGAGGELPDTGRHSSLSFDSTLSEDDYIFATYPRVERGQRPPGSLRAEYLDGRPEVTRNLPPRRNLQLEYRYPGPSDDNYRRPHQRTRDLHVPMVGLPPHNLTVTDDRGPNPHSPMAEYRDGRTEVTRNLPPRRNFQLEYRYPGPGNNNLRRDPQQTRDQPRVGHYQQDPILVGDQGPPPRGLDLRPRSPPPGVNYVIATEPRRKEWTVNPFDGKQDWNSYWAQFGMVAQFNKWSPEVQAMHLVKALVGSARTVLADMSAEQMSCLPSVVSALERRYKPKEKIPAYRALFNGKRQGPKESSQEYGDDLRLLALKAFPTDSTETREARLIDRFIDGLQNPDLRKHVMFAHPLSLESATSLTLEWEAFEEAQNVSGYKKPKDRAFALKETEEEQSAMKKTTRELQEKIDALTKLFQNSLKNENTTPRSNMATRGPREPRNPNSGPFQRPSRFNDSNNRGSKYPNNHKGPRAQAYSQPQPFEFQGKCFKCQQFGHLRKNCPFGELPQVYQNQGN